jgi:hypothetical protein
MDGLALLRAAEEHRLEGVVSKHRDAPYRSGECRNWLSFSVPGTLADHNLSAFRPFQVCERLLRSIVRDAESEAVTPKM